MSEVKFAEGMYAEKPKEGTPDFVKAKLSITVEKFVEFLKENQNDKGYVNIDVLESEKGVYYAKLDNFEPNTNYTR